jgi:GH25 family lysozyme M1 (1,4-beta-N-acetylmuramidase)
MVAVTNRSARRPRAHGAVRCVPPTNAAGPKRTRSACQQPHRYPHEGTGTSAAQERIHWQSLASGRRGAGVRADRHAVQCPTPVPKARFP